MFQVKVKELFLKSGYDYAIIIEDDAQFQDNFDELVKKVIEQYASLSNKHRWDVLKLNSYGRKKMIEVKKIDENHSLFGGSVGITTLAAIWTRNGAKSFLEKTSKNGHYIINMPIDCALQKHWKYNLKIYNIAPELVKSRSFNSQIQQKKLKSYFFKRINFEMRKLLPRLYYFIKTWMLRY